MRTPQSIQSYATLATIVFQTNQNEQHGGQSIPAFDHFMAPGVLKTFRRHLTDMTLFLCGVRGGVTLERAELKALVAEHVPTIEPCETAVGRLFAALRQQIERKGCVISEYPPESEPVGAVGFLQRNRLIAALSGALVVVEAKEKSGTMSTVGHAERYGNCLLYTSDAADE